MTRAKEPKESRAGARAFNEGSDARLRGDRLADNPYPHDQGGERRLWQSGWKSVQDGWGADVRGRWYVPPLPPLLLGRPEEKC